jgi:membrane protease YdiL (CAAX protease family)
VPFTLVSFGAVLVYIWFVEPRAPREAVAVPIAIVIVAALIHAVGRRESGFAIHALAGGFVATIVFTMVASAIVIAAGLTLGSWRWRPDLLGTLGGLMVWGGAQQWVLQTMALREAQRAAGKRAGIVLAAALFATLHLPNPFLTAMTFICGLAWCAIYAWYPNVLPLALSHAIGTLVVRCALDDRLAGGFQVGAAYLERVR